MAGLKCLTFIYTIDKDMNNTACVLSCNAYVFTTQHTRASGVENKSDETLTARLSLANIFMQSDQFDEAEGIYMQLARTMFFVEGCF